MLNAGGEAVLAETSATAHSSSARAAAAGQAESGYTPPCQNVCDTYHDGVNQETPVLCMDWENDGWACKLEGCNNGLCQQSFDDECQGFCSEWAAGVTKDTIEVCQGPLGAERHICMGRSMGACQKNGYYMCRQKQIQPCPIACEDYNSGATQDSELVCLVESDESTDPVNFGYGTCLGLPCAGDPINHRPEENHAYNASTVCHQSYLHCEHHCLAGSPAPIHSTVCYDDYDHSCTNPNPECPRGRKRCKPKLAPVSDLQQAEQHAAPDQRASLVRVATPK